MLSIEIACPLMIGFLSLIVAGHEAGCSKPSTDVPKQFQYSFGSVALVREGDYVAVASASAWTNTQVPPPAEFDPTPCARLISLDDFARLVAQLQEINLAPLTAPVDNVFEHTPPDMNHIESFRLMVDGRTLIDWSKLDYVLIASVRQPLDAFNDSVKNLWVARTSDPVLPTRFLLSMTAPSRKDSIQFELTRTEQETKLTERRSGKSRAVSEKEFTSFWSELMRVDALCNSYRASGPRVPSQPLANECKMTVIVNGWKVVSFIFGKEFYGRDRFDLVTAYLDSLWYAPEK